ncbi:solute carrier family 7 member genderblind [Arctopsyche grandis]|uniref:solute carrier family 7 member genderblind n=1 Tax=Arctopsyche grandis TaxID=121162 RepID=UPI00406D8DE1
MSEERIRMKKQLGLLEGVAIILGIIFGSGIFISPKGVLQQVGSVWGALAVWTACGGLATLGALCYAELGTTLAQSGGDYHYIHQAFGPLPAFLYLWDANIVFVPTTNAIMSLTFANYVLQPLFPTCMVPDGAQRLIAALTICILTFINAYDVRFTTKMQNVFMFTKISALALIIIAGIIWMAKDGLENFDSGWEGTTTDISKWSVGFYSGIFSYSGWSYLNFMTEELQDPFVNLPRAIYISLPLVTTIYVLANVAYLAVLGPQGVLASPAIAVMFAQKSMGWLSWFMPVLVAIAALGGLSVHIMTSSRMCFAGARNGHMPALLSHLNIKCLTPLPSLVFLMLMSLLMLISGDVYALITYCTVVESFFTTLSAAAVLWLRYKRPELERPIKVPLWIPIVFVGVCVLLLIVPCIQAPMEVGVGALITLAGTPIFMLCIKHTHPILTKISCSFTKTCQKIFLSAQED